MSKTSHKETLLKRRRKRVRKKVTGTPEFPRLSIRRSLKHIYAQVIDDSTGRTLAQASSVSMKISGGNAEAAKQVGKGLAEAAKTNSVSRVRFDRGGRLYHGRVKALAEAARKGGLEI